MKIDAVPWPEVAERYRELVEDYGWPLEPMLVLVRSMEVSSYASGLVAYTSMMALIVAQSEANFWRGPELRIEFDPFQRKLFTFTYNERQDVKNPWTRTAHADEGFEVLEHFLVKRARWFRKPAAEQETPSPHRGRGM